MGLALLPFMEVLVRAPVLKRTLMVSLIYLTFYHLSAACQTTGNIEGFIYFRPEYFTPRLFLLTQPEIIEQSLALELNALSPVPIRSCTPHAKGGTVGFDAKTRLKDV